jgi:hypothetical protein
MGVRCGQVYALVIKGVEGLHKVSVLEKSQPLGVIMSFLGGFTKSNTKKKKDERWPVEDNVVVWRALLAGGGNVGHRTVELPSPDKELRRPVSPLSLIRTSLTSCLGYRSSSLSSFGV